MIKKTALILGVVLILFFWKNTILHIGTQSHDWYDGSFMVWSIQTNINHFKNFRFDKIFETNAMYPFPQSLSFTDHLFVPSFIALLISFFSSNPILQFNLLWILNHIAVFLTFYLFAGRFTKNFWSRIIPAFYMSFGPYFFLQFGHLQMVFLWPLFLSLYYLLDPKKSVKSIIVSGIFLGVQFLTGTYLGLLGLTIIFLYFIVEIIKTIFIKSTFIKKQVFISQLKSFGLFFISFVIVAGVSIYGYLLLNQTYHPKRDQGEYVTFSAHASDYLFPLPLRSSYIYKHLSHWTDLNKHNYGEQASFVGFVPLLVIGGYIFMSLRGVKRRSNLKGIAPLSRERGIARNDKLYLWLGLLIITGFVFSLGPRMNWNGKYLVTPLPYWLVMKVFPPIAIMRAVARWYFLVIFAVSIFMIFGIDLLLHRFKKFTPIIIGGLLVLIFFEFYPSPIQTISRSWKTNSYIFLQKQCQIKSGPILEYPIEYRADDFTYVNNLQYKTNILMSSTLHTCPFLSGFSSYEPRLFLKWKDQFDMNGFDQKTMDILQEQKFMYIKINLKALSAKEQQNTTLFIHTKKLELIYKDLEILIYKIIYLN